MRIRIRTFAALRDITASQKFYLDCDDKSTAGDAIKEIGRLYPDSIHILKNSALAKNGAFTVKEILLKDGDELSILPPVSGG